MKQTVLVLIAFLFCSMASAQTICGLRYDDYYTKAQVISKLGKPDSYRADYELGNAYLIFIYGENMLFFDFPYPEEDAEFEVEYDEKGIEGHRFVWTENDRYFTTQKGRFVNFILRNPDSALEFPDLSIRVGESLMSLFDKRISIHSIGKAKNCCGIYPSVGNQFYYSLVSYTSEGFINEIACLQKDTDVGHRKASLSPVDIAFIGGREFKVGDTFTLPLNNVNCNFYIDEPHSCHITYCKSNGVWIFYKLTYDRRGIMDTNSW